jgi:predicted CXXCH cytochrome family protein
MRPGLLLAVMAAVAWLSALALAQSSRTASSAAGDRVDPAREYVGSGTCQGCHENAYAAWRDSLHVQMTRRIEEAVVLGDFAAPGHPPERFEAHYTLGAKRFQGYISRLPDGAMYVLPAFWNVAWRRWVNWTEITPVPEEAHDLRQIWNINCFNCHATNIERGFDVATRTFATSVTEFGVGCEACHGPGRVHVERMLAWRADPGARPADVGIFSTTRATARQVYDTCAYCHGNKTNYFTGFAPGDRLEDFAQLALVSDPVPSSDPQGDYWPDGRPSRFNRPQALTLSECFRGGQLACTACHVAHGSPYEHSLKRPIGDSDRLCTQCHAALAPRDAAARHSRHAPGSEGSSCVQCHMSDVNWRLLTRRRDHTFAPPVPELTARFGVPNACTTCHEDRSPEWAAAAMDAWYGDAARRRRAVAAADTMYAAGAGDRDVTGRLASLATDPKQGALLRASAAGFIGRLMSAERLAAPSVVEALIAASADPEAMVRVAAVRALGATATDEARGALARRLTDESRVVRLSAAEGLLAAGVATADGALGLALRRAQDEYAASLQTFPDVAANQASLGWLLASRGETDAALRALRLAVTLDPADPRPRVYLGVMAARAGRYDEAIDEWRAARQLNPAYPNIDRLIAEAERRR